MEYYQFSMYGGFDVYKTYLAVKLHFASDTYDYYKYDGKVNAKLDTFTKRKDRYFFHKLSTRYAESDILDFFVANFLADSKRWIGNLLANDGRNVYLDDKNSKEAREARKNWCNCVTEFGQMVSQEVKTNPRYSSIREI